MTPSNEQINDWLKAAEASPEPRFLIFATLAAEWGAKEEREACAEMVDHILKEGGGTYGDAIRARGQENKS